MANAIIAFLEREFTAADAELSGLLEAQSERDAERASRKRMSRVLNGAKTRTRKKGSSPFAALPNRAAAFRAASRLFVTQYLLAERHLLKLSDINDIRGNVWKNRPQFETALQQRNFEKRLDEYLQGLAVRLARSRPATPLPVQAAWSEEDVRAILKLRADLGESGVQALRGLQARNELAALIYHRDNANVILAERFIHSNHLSSLSEFERVAQIYRTDVPLLSDVTRPIAVAVWQKSVDELVSEVRRWFGGTAFHSRDLNVGQFVGMAPK